MAHFIPLTTGVGKIWFNADHARIVKPAVPALDGDKPKTVIVDVTGMRQAVYETVDVVLELIIGKVPHGIS